MVADVAAVGGGARWLLSLVRILGEISFGQFLDGLGLAPCPLDLEGCLV